MSILIISIIIIVVLLLVVWYFKKSTKVEGFRAQQGQFCMSCQGKSYNQCLNCFNCGWCVDEFGNGGCVGGDVNSGPYNKEQCAQWDTNDPFTDMKYMNSHYKMSYGPKQSNRVYGVNPCLKCAADTQ